MNPPLTDDGPRTVLSGSAKFLIREDHQLVAEVIRQKKQIENWTPQVRRAA